MKNSTKRPIQMRFLAGCMTVFIAFALGGRIAYCEETTHTGSFSVSNTSDRVVDDMGEVMYKFNPPAGVPEGAKVARIFFTVVIDNNGSESNFFPKDYEIWLSSESHGGYTYSCEYDNKGVSESNVDEGFDDDPDNDTDIFLRRYISTLSGENADQFYAVMVRDNSPGGSGKVTCVELFVYYEAPDLPNLNVDRTPPGWSAPIVVTSSADGYTQVDNVYANTDYFVKCALYNSSDYAVTSNFDWELNIAGYVSPYTVTYRIPAHELYPRTTLRRFEAGNRSICSRADPSNTLKESFENDNEHCITLNVIGAPVAPVLSSPADHSTCQPIDNNTLIWSPVDFATSYQIQIDENAEFSSPYSFTRTETELLVSGWEAGTKYFWRVRASNPAGYSGFSGTRSLITSPGAPGVPLLSSPSNSAGCQSVSLKLDWQDAANASTYNLQLDNNSDFSSPVVNQSGVDISEFNVTGLIAGITYYWRVSSSNGCTSSVWSSVYSFNVSQTPSIPSLASPADAASCQPLSFTLSWNTVSGAESYEILVDNNSDLGSPIVNQNVNSASWDISGLSEGITYYWTVRARNNCGVYSAWSEPRSFTTLIPSATVPELYSPTNAASCQPLSLNLSWNEVANASAYALQVDYNGDFGSLVINQTGIVSTIYPVSGLNSGTTYYWRVMAVSYCGSPSSWSAIRSFTTSSDPGVPSLAGPANAVGCQALNLTLSWNSASSAVSYDIKVDDNSDFSSVITDLNNVTATSTAISGLTSSVTYFWKVRSRNGCGAYSDWSEVRSFSTTGSPSAPVLSSPANISSCQPINLTLSWNSAGSYVFDLMVDNNSDFSSPVFNQSDLSAASQVISGLAEGTEYFWKVRAANPCGIESPWSATNSFTTMLSSIGLPDLTMPANDAQCQPNNPTLSWGSVSNATGYSLQVDDNADFSSVTYAASCAGISHNCGDLVPGTVYYWRVSAAGNCSVAGSWSVIRSFKTGNGALSKPTLVSPENNASNQPSGLSLDWGNVSDANKYQLQLDDNNDFSSPLYDAEQAGVSKSISGLSGGTGYFWHVRAIGECSASDWSDVWKFETATITDIPDNPETPGFYMKQNYPNPFKERTTIEFCIPVGTCITFEMVNMQGVVIKSYSAWYPAGKNSLEINLGNEVTEGIYLYRIKTDHFTATGKCLVKP